MLETIPRLSAASIFAGYSLLVIALIMWTSRRRSVTSVPMPRMLPIALIVLSAAIFAQQSGDTDRNLANSSIQGLVTVKGPSGKPSTLNGVTIQLSGGVLEQQSLSVLTDTDGHYQFEHLRAGTYQLEVKVKGCQPFTKTVRLRRNEMHVENIALRVDSATVAW